MMKVTITKPETFTVWSTKIENRLDPFFHQRYFHELENQLKNSKHQLVKLGSLCTAYRGVTYSRDDEVENGIKILRANNITLATNEINLDDVRNIRADFSVTEKQKLKAGDILMSAASGSKEHVGKTAYIAKDIDFYFGSFMMVLRADKNKIDPQYLFEFLSSKIFRNLFFHILGGTNINNLNFSMIENFEIPLPSPTVQTKIAKIAAKNRAIVRELEKKVKRIIVTIDDYVLSELGIARKKERVSDVAQIWQVWSDEVVSGGRLDSKYWIPAIRKFQQSIQNGKYKSQKLGDFIDEIHYGVSITNKYVDDGIRFLRILNLKEEGLDLSDVVYLPEETRAIIGKAFVREDDMLISRSGSVGIVVVVPKEADGFAFGSFIIRFTLSDKINKHYVSVWLNNEANKKLIEREKIGAVQGNITIKTIKNFDIPFPPLSVQEKVVQKIQAAYEEKHKKEMEIKTILASIDDFVLGELGIAIEKERK